MLWIRGLVAVAVVGVALTVPATAEAQQVLETIRCESVNDRHQECAFRSTGIVTVHVKKQLSSTPCVYNQNWSDFGGKVWVESGCRAEFEIRRPPQTKTSRPVGGTFQSVTCESRDGNRRECDAPGLDPSSVTMERKLSASDCVQGRSWGSYDGGIWVDNGCRAVFAYVKGGTSYTPYSNTQYDHDVNCESRGGEWVHCAVDQIHSARVELIASNSQCEEYKAWGVDDTGVWVRSQCRGTWRVRYRH